MGVLKTALSMPARHGHTLTIKSFYGGASNQVGPARTLLYGSRFAPAAMVSCSRHAHSQDITKNMQYISQDKLQRKADPKTMKLNVPVDKPLCIMLNWLLAPQKHIMKYATIYLEQGYDVLSVSCSPWQIMWPTKGSQLVAADLLRFMTSNESTAPLTVHGFSVGGYMWGELCMHAAKNKPLYQPVIDRVQAQVWDSAADISEVNIGVPVAVFPNNKYMQNMLKTYIEYHMKHFHEAATVHWIRSLQQFRLNPCRAPALFLLSKTDPVGVEHTNRKVADSWISLGTKVTWKCWDASPHVKHFTEHPKEYVGALYGHLDAAGLVYQHDKMRMRL